MSEIYEPREDTYLILEAVKKYASGNVLDVGTGSGILALAASVRAENVVGVDINEEAIEFAKGTAKSSGVDNIQFHQSDLFSYFEMHPQKFDVIFFNPPYLPEHPSEPEESKLITTGGKKGYELIERFFSEVSTYLMPYGKIIVLFSTLTGKEKIHEIMENHGFNYQKLVEEELFAETLFVYSCEKSIFLKELENRGLTDLKKLAKGHRGIIFTGDWDGTKVAIKRQNEASRAIGRIENEARWLKVLNRKNIGPKFLFFYKDYFIYEFVEGVFLPEYLEGVKKSQIKAIFKKIFNQCYVMDKMGIDKEEMHNPYKHILVQNGNPTMIDFERVNVSLHPKNVTQFCQYISSSKMKKLDFKVEKRRIIAAAKKYKKDMTKKNLQEIIELIK